MCYSNMKIFLGKRLIYINLKFFLVHIGDALGVCMVANHHIYLGLPIVIRRDRKAIFARSKKRLWGKLQD